MTYYIYMLRCEDNSLYTGITTDLKRRFEEHISKKGSGAKYTHSRMPLKIAAAWKTEGGRSAALKLEAFLKKMKKSEKESLTKAPQMLSDFLAGRFERIEFSCIQTDALNVKNA